MSRSSWWASKVHQFRSHLTARVRPAEREEVAAWLEPGQLALFDAMHVADRRHGLDVVGVLRGQGVQDRDVLIAGLLHDAGKGRVGVLPRVAHSLGQAYGPWVGRAVSVLPAWRRDLVTLAEHAETSAALAAEAGCSQRTVELIRHQEAPRDPEFGELLRLADEAS
ncbi:MAG TPA: hypothetical protein VLA23_03735 [Candidatus Limnocylindrales bacterium]|nr:hypothetical protein [Candidatus Limnocylindrales bacterium]